MIRASVVSPLELFHPRGYAVRSLAIGHNAPSLLELVDGDAEQAVDVALLAPTVRECGMHGWLEQAVEHLVLRLAADGIIYVLAPTRWRKRLVRLLQARGLLIEGYFAHLPDQATSRFLVPLQRPTMRYAISTIPMRHWKRRAVMLALQVPNSIHILAHLLPWVGFVARRPRAARTFAWLSWLGGTQEASGSAMMSISWRGKTGAVILHRFGNQGDQPLQVAKITPLDSRTLEHEAAILKRLGASAWDAGARVPQALYLDRIGQCEVLLQSAMHGQPAATLLATRSVQLHDVLELLTSWLARWHRTTLVSQQLDGERLHRAVGVPMATLAPLLPNCDAYTQWLDQRCEEVIGIEVPLVATHNDLTMWNVLLDKDAHLSIVDWAEGAVQGFPLVDFFYAVTDAIAAAGEDGNRLDAFKACFTDTGPYTSSIRRLVQQMHRAIPIPQAIGELCFHICWLHHAANEHQVRRELDAGPFLRIIQWLAQHPDMFRGIMYESSAARS